MHQEYIVEQGPVQLHAEEEQQVLAVEAGWPESAVAGRLLLILAGTQQGSGEPAADDLLLDVPEFDFDEAVAAEVKLADLVELLVAV